MTGAIALDPGNGGIKIYGSNGRLAVQSEVSLGLGDTIRRMTGLRLSHPSLKAHNRGGFPRWRRGSRLGEAS